MKKRTAFVYVCMNETSFNRVRQIVRRHNIEFRIVGQNVITYEEVKTNMQDVILETCEENFDDLQTKYYLFKSGEK